MGKTTIRIDLEREESEKFEAIKRTLGVSANSEVIRHLVTKEYQDLDTKGLLKPRFEHINTFEDHAKITDYDIRKVVSIYFQDEGRIWCDLDETNDCAHIDFALTIPEVKAALRERGWQRK